MDSHLTLWCMLLSFFLLFFLLFAILLSLSMDDPAAAQSLAVPAVPPFLRLPDELQIRIFSQLPSQELLKATAVCNAALFFPLPRPLLILCTLLGLPPLEAPSPRRHAVDQDRCHAILQRYPLRAAAQAGRGVWQIPQNRQFQVCLGIKSKE